VIGISKDSVAKQSRFRQKYALPFTLLSDPDGRVCEAYGVLADKNMYGKIFKGIERTTFVINADGFIDRVYSKVKVEGHARAVLEDVEKSDPGRALTSTQEEAPSEGV
jgi:peroxiredoxin Q/BCP